LGFSKADQSTWRDFTSTRKWSAATARNTHAALFLSFVDGIVQQ